MSINCAKPQEMGQEIKYKYKTFIGVDEVGRGCLAGPVIAAAVYVKNEDVNKISEINDSKQLSEKIRERLYVEISKNHKFAIGIVSNKTIDKINILQSSLLAMKLAVEKLNKRSEIILVDGIYKIPLYKSLQKTEIKGDQKFYSIAAASIIAKVFRDKIMKDYSIQYPDFTFDKHKGYGTKKHKEEIKKFGVLKIHRKSFNLI